MLNIQQCPASPVRSDDVPARELMKMTLEDLRPYLLLNGRNHFISTNASHWFKTCLVDSENDVWSEAMAANIDSDLRAQGVLTDEGWTQLSKLIEDRENEDTSYGQFAQYSRNIAEALEKRWEKDYRTKPPPRTTTYETSGAHSGSYEVISPDYRPDGRFVLNEPTKTVNARQFSGRPQRRGYQDPPKYDTPSTGSSDGEEVSKQERDEEYKPGNKKEGPRFCNADCAAVAEFKLSDAAGDISQNEAQTAAGPYLLFFNDPRRTRIYAISINEAITRLWCFDRGGIRVTDDFDCHERPEWIIRFFLYLTFADKEKLGYDSTVQRMYDEKNAVFYVYLCDGKYYRTIGPPQAEESAFFLISRGVRTWRVRPCNKDGELISSQDPDYIIKDYWLYKTRDGEDKQRKAINSDKGLDPEQRGRLQALSTEILADVEVGNDITIPWGDEWKAIRFRSLEPRAVAPRYIKNTRSNTSGGTGLSDLISSPARPKDYDIAGTQKIHRRTLFKEWCVTLYRMCKPDSGYTRQGTLRDFLVVVLDLIEALSLLRQTGFVHRDISAGNCLAYWNQERQTWEGKLSDFEYCKRYQDITSGDPITGTLIFAAVETRSRAFVFTPLAHPVEYPPNSNAGHAAATTGGLPRLPPRKEVSTEPPMFQYHPYHDLEALYWVILWVIIHHTINIKGSATTQRPPKEHLDQWRILSDKLFNTQDFSGRMALLSNRSAESKGLIAKLTRWGWSQDAMGILTEIVGVRQDIVDAYLILQAQPQMPLENRPAIKQWGLDKFTDVPYAAMWSAIDRAKTIVEELEEAGKLLEMKPVRTLIEEQQAADRKQEQDKAKESLKASSSVGPVEAARIRRKRAATQGPIEGEPATSRSRGRK